MELGFHLFLPKEINIKYLNGMPLSCIIILLPLVYIEAFYDPYFTISGLKILL